MKRSGIFFFISLAFIIGIAVGLLGRHDFLIIYCLVIADLILLTSFWRNTNLRILFFGLLFLFLGVFRAGINRETRYMLEQNAVQYYGEEVAVRGFVSEAPHRSNSWQRFKIKPISDQKLKSDILVYTSLYPEYKYGSELELVCRLTKPTKFGNYRYDEYLMAEGIYSICYYPKIKTRALQDCGNYAVKKLFLFRKILLSLVRKNVQEPEAQLLSAILLGDRDGIPSELKDLFSRAGISHIIAISGMHMAVFAVIILYFLIFLGTSRKVSFYICAFIIFLYVIMIAAPVSAVRAALMSFVALLAIKLGRLSKFVNVLNLTVCLMLILQPAILFYDIGFQLSFIALIGIVYMGPIIKKMLNIMRIFKPVKDLISISLAAEIFVLPLAIYYFGIISLFALFVNLAVIWLVPITMALGMFFLLIGLLNLFLPLLFLAKIAGLVIGFFLNYLIRVASLLTPSWSVLNIAKFPLWGVMVCYIFLGIFIARFKEK